MVDHHRVQRFVRLQSQRRKHTKEPCRDILHAESEHVCKPVVEVRVQRMLRTEQPDVVIREIEQPRDEAVDVRQTTVRGPLEGLKC